MNALLHDTAAFLAMCAFVAGVAVASIALTPPPPPAAAQFTANTEEI